MGDAVLDVFGGFDRDEVIAHFTRGGPCFEGYEACDDADAWRAVRDPALFVRRDVR